MLAESGGPALGVVEVRIAAIDDDVAFAESAAAALRWSHRRIDGRGHDPNDAWRRELLHDIRERRAAEAPSLPYLLTVSALRSKVTEYGRAQQAPVMLPPILPRPIIASVHKSRLGSHQHAPRGAPSKAFKAQRETRERIGPA